MKVSVGRDEWWPVYFIETEWEYPGIMIELTDEEYERYKMAEKEFDAVQDLISEKYHKAK